MSRGIRGIHERLCNCKRRIGYELEMQGLVPDSNRMPWYLDILEVSVKDYIRGEQAPNLKCKATRLKGQMHHQNDLGSKWAYTCHLSNKTSPEPVLFSTTQL